jgi:phosphoenolpyruvate carboxylase
MTNRKIDLSATIRLLGNVLGEVIAELESQALFEREERVRKLAKERRAGQRTPGAWPWLLPSTSTW